MMEVRKEKFEAVEQAIRDALNGVTDTQGLRIKLPDRCFERHVIEHAATMAMMSATGGFVRPQGMKFIRNGQEF